jgi:hypothetical protein
MWVWHVGRSSGARRLPGLSTLGVHAGQDSHWLSSLVRAAGAMNAALPCVSPAVEVGHLLLPRGRVWLQQITGHLVRAPASRAESTRDAATMASIGSSAVLCAGTRPAQVRSVQSPGASGPVEIWRKVAITVTSGQYFACSSANSR